MSNRTNGAIATLSAIAIAITSLGIQPASAAPARGDAIPAAAKAQAVTPLTTQVRVRGRYYRRNNAAALGVFLGIAGTVAAVAAAQHRRNYYGYYGAPYGYYGGPGYYGGGPYGYYAPRFYPGYRRW
jgi:hypothetical protein